MVLVCLGACLSFLSRRAYYFSCLTVKMIQNAYVENSLSFLGETHRELIHTCCKLSCENRHVLINIIVCWTLAIRTFIYHSIHILYVNLTHLSTNNCSDDWQHRFPIWSYFIFPAQSDHYQRLFNDRMNHIWIYIIWNRQSI